MPSRCGSPTGAVVDVDAVARWLTDAFTAVWVWVSGFLNKLDPFDGFIDAALQSEFVRYVRWVNYFLDLGFFVKGLGALLAALAVYYAVQVLLRWLKVIE